MPNSNNPFHHFAGLLIYFVYGMHFSVQRKRHKAAYDDTDTASNEKQPYVISEEKFWVFLCAQGVEIEMFQWVTVSRAPAVLGVATLLDTFLKLLYYVVHIFIYQQSKIQKKMCFKYGMTPGMFWYLFLLLVAEASAIVKNSIRKKGHRYFLLQTVICILS